MTAATASPADTPPPSPIGRPHSLLEDAYAIFIGCALLIVGLVFLKAAGLVTSPPFPPSGLPRSAAPGEPREPTPATAVEG